MIRKLHSIEINDYKFLQSKHFFQEKAYLFFQRNIYYTNLFKSLQFFILRPICELMFSRVLHELILINIVKCAFHALPLKENPSHSSKKHNLSSLSRHISPSPPLLRGAIEFRDPTADNSPYSNSKPTYIIHNSMYTVSLC